MKLHSKEWRLRFKRGLRASLSTIETSGLGAKAEPYYTTDTKQLFIHDGAVCQPVLTLDMAVTDRADGSIIVDRETGGLIFDY